MNKYFSFFFKLNMICLSSLVLKKPQFVPFITRIGISKFLEFWWISCILFHFFILVPYIICLFVFLFTFSQHFGSYTKNKPEIFIFSFSIKFAKENVWDIFVFQMLTANGVFARFTAMSAHLSILITIFKERVSLYYYVDYCSWMNYFIIGRLYYKLLVWYFFRLSKKSELESFEYKFPFRLERKLSKNNPNMNSCAFTVNCTAPGHIYFK